MSKIVILKASPRKNGNSNALAAAFAEEAKKAGASVTEYDATNMQIGGCRSCYGCMTKGDCVIRDDFEKVAEGLRDADGIVIASPVYWYTFPAQLKAVIDRTVARWTEVKNKKFYYIVTCADGDKRAVMTTLDCMRGYADCVDGAVERGVIYGTGVYQKGEIRISPAMKQAYEMGRSV